MRASPRVGDGVRSWQLLFRDQILTVPCYKIRVRIGINSENLILIPTRREIHRKMTLSDDE